MNWQPATYVGQITFDDFSADNDLDFRLYDATANAVKERLGGFYPGGTIRPILTKDSQGEGSEYKDALRLELAGYELSEHFLYGGWPTFHYREYEKIKPRTRDDYDKAISNFFYRKTAVVTGLLGLDCVHECHVELHPLHAIAIRTKYECSTDKGEPIIHTKTGPLAPNEGDCAATSKPNSDVMDDDSWMIFATNHGNEGSCGSDYHYLDRQMVTVNLPIPLGATVAPATTGSDFYSNRSDLSWALGKPDFDARTIPVTFYFVPNTCVGGTVDEQVRVHGALHLHWSTGTTTSTLFDSSCPECRESDPGYMRYVKNQRTASDLDKEHVTPLPTPKAISGCDWTNMQSEDAISDRSIKLDKMLDQTEDKTGRPGIWAKVKMVSGYTKANFAVFGGVQTFPSARGFAEIVGARTELLGTPLGTIETEVSTSYLFPGKVTSQSGKSFNVRISDWLTGTRIQVGHSGSPFVDVLKLGGIYRSVDSPAAQSTEFRHFKGLDFVLYTGGGFEPGREGHRVSVRFSGGVIFVPHTGEKIVRLVVGPQFRRKG